MRPALILFATFTLAAQSPTEKAITTVLDDWHLAAAKADETRYFGHFADGAIFLGTDATERWTKAAFRTWAHPHFQRGKTWDFRSTRRAISVSSDGRTAWFDEDLATSTMGPCRGSGVLTLERGRWLLRQYNLSVPIPNALMQSVKAQVEQLSKKQ